MAIVNGLGSTCRALKMMTKSLTRDEKIEMLKEQSDNGGWFYYLAFRDGLIQLDGYFTSSELRGIADILDEKERC